MRTTKKKDSSYGITNSSQFDVKPIYYIPDIKDFRLGAIYNQRWIGGLNGWRESILDETHYDASMGHCEMMSIISQVKWTKGEYYRIKFLDTKDLELLGFVYDDTTKIWSLSNCFISIDWTRKNNIKVTIDDEIVFYGKLLNMCELKEVLVMTGILKDTTRDEKFKQYKIENNL